MILPQLEAHLRAKPNGSRTTIVVPHAALGHALEAKILEQHGKILGIVTVTVEVFLHRLRALALACGHAIFRPGDTAETAIILRTAMLEGRLSPLGYFSKCLLLESQQAFQAFADTLHDLDGALVTPGTLRSMKLSGTSAKRMADVALAMELWLDYLQNQNLASRGQVVSEVLTALDNPKFAKVLANDCGEILWVASPRETYWQQCLRERIEKRIGGVKVISASQTAFSTAWRVEPWETNEGEWDSMLAWVGEILQTGGKAPSVPNVAIVTTQAAAAVERLQRAFPDLKIHCAGGLPWSCCTEGVRIHGVLQAVGSGLVNNDTLPVLAWLESEENASYDRWVGAANEAFILGGPGRESQWLSLTTPGSKFERFANEMNALVSVAKMVAANAPLKDLAPALAAFVAVHIRKPFRPQGVVEEFCRRCDHLSTTGVADILVGAEALNAVSRECLQPQTVGCSEFRGARLFVGSPRESWGLSFDHMRVIGANEGNIVSSPSDDAVLPDTDRAVLQIDALMRKSSLRARNAEIQYLLSTTAPLPVLSFSHQGPDGHESSPAPFVVDLVMKHNSSVSFSAAISSLRKQALSQTTNHTHTRRQMIRDLRSRGSASIPVWGCKAFSPAQAAAKANRKPKSLDFEDGLLNPKRSQSWTLPGLDSQRPIRVSEVSSALNCPLRFVLSAQLRWREADTPCETVECTSWGTLVHTAINEFTEGFFRDATRNITTAKKIANAIVSRLLSSASGLASLAVDAHELQTQKDELKKILLDVWQRDGDKKVKSVPATEQDLQVALTVAKGKTLHLKGTMDRLEFYQGGKWGVVDFKTGRCKENAKTTAENPAIQAAVYSLMALQEPSLKTLNLKESKFAGAELLYLHGEPEALPWPADLTAARAALEQLHDVLVSGLAVANPTENWCKHCVFSGHCGATDDYLTRALAHPHFGKLTGRDENL